MTRFLIAAMLCLAATGARAQVEVKDPWVRATVPQQKTIGAFLQLTASKSARLIEVSSLVANVVEIHEMKMENGVMTMRAIPGIDFPAGKAVELKPGGYHAMLMDLKKQIKEGDRVPIMLVVESDDHRHETIEISALAQPLNMHASGGRMH